MHWLKKQPLEILQSLWFCFWFLVLFLGLPRISLKPFLSWAFTILPPLSRNCPCHCLCFVAFADDGQTKSNKHKPLYYAPGLLYIALQKLVLLLYLQLATVLLRMPIFICSCLSQSLW